VLVACVQITKKKITITNYKGSNFKIKIYAIYIYSLGTNPASIVWPPKTIIIFWVGKVM